MNSTSNENSAYSRYSIYDFKKRSPRDRSLETPTITIKPKEQPNTYHDDF